ncbi:MAG: trypsin-like peptidase domain-containing protein [Actinomycetota bacterium]
MLRLLAVLLLLPLPALACPTYPDTAAALADCAAAAEGGDAGAIRRLFDAAWYGRPGPRSPEAAEAWLARALARGASWARLVQAVRLEETDPAQAAELYGQAAVAGSCQAELRLARGHDRGGWIERNRTQAYFWALVAARPGADHDSHPLFDDRFHVADCQTEAFFLRSELAARVPPELRTRAEAAAASWRPGTVPDRLGPADAPAALGVAAPLKGSVLPPWHPAGPPSHAGAAGRLTAEQVFAAASPSVWVVEAARTPEDLARHKGRTGSAVAVGADALATNCHVVAEMGAVSVSRAGRRLAAEVAAGDDNTDRCLLRVAGGGLTAVARVRPFSDLKVGETVYSLGAPRGLEATLGQGLVSGMRRVKGMRYVQTTAPIAPGSSGGGLFDSAGNLVGITTFQLGAAQGLNFAIAAEEFFH